jgi:hypothetical protein
MSKSMSVKRRAGKGSARSGILLRYRDKDSAYGVTRTTATRLASALGLSETQVVHVALANLARQALPRYEVDEGPIDAKLRNEIRRLQPSGRMKVKERLF